uniref:Uncharacterized protein n=1 Tax=Arundo donax TaxID=35708 RepID=A0A0A8ZGM7_ARUDO
MCVHFGIANPLKPIDQRLHSNGLKAKSTTSHLFQ